MTESQRVFAAGFEHYQNQMPNPLRTLADGNEMMSCFIKPWCDDASGGRTKQYQAHNNIYIAHTNIPGELLNQEFFIRFASTATHASSTEQFAALKQQLNNNNKNPIRVYNVLTGTYIWLQIYILNLPADNPAQSEEALHIGGSGNLSCRRCKVGGPYQVTETREGYAAYYEPCTVDDTTKQIWDQIMTACLGVESRVLEMQSKTGVKDCTAQSIITELIKRGREIQTRLRKSGQPTTEDLIMTEQLVWLKKQSEESFNALLQIHSLDPHRDTPIEILHTILLGVEKCTWHYFHTSMKENALSLFATWLQSSNLDGLGLDSFSAKYIIKYPNNLIGRCSRSPASQLTQPDSDLHLASALASLSTSPHESDIPFPPSPARGGGYEASSESDGETQPGPSTPVRSRTRRSSQPPAPAPIRIYSEQRNRNPVPTRESSPAAHPTLVLVTPAPAPAPAAPRPMAVSTTTSSSIRDAWSQINSLGRFADGNKPMREAEYRFNFIAYTQGLSDEDIAKLWIGNLKYDSPAHLWLEDLQAVDPDKAKKWSLLEKEIEKRWPTPKRDHEARKIGLRRSWEDHTFNIEAMVAGLMDETSTVRPHQVSAKDHKALALSVNSTDEDCVAKTVDYDLPQWLVNLLPKWERYGSDFEGLIKDLGEITSRTLLNTWSRECSIDSLLAECTQAMSLAATAKTTRPYPQPPSTPAWQPQLSAYQPPTSRPSTLTPRCTQVRFSSRVQLAPPPQPPEETRPLPQPPRPPFARQQPPHLLAPPPTPVTPQGAVRSVLSRVEAAQSAAPAAAVKVPDTSDDQSRWRAEVTHWHVENEGRWLTLKRPYPLSPGTFEQTASLCPKCGRGEHSVLSCPARGDAVLDEHERKFREAVARRLKDCGRVGEQPTTPTPAQRYQDTNQLELSEPESDGALLSEGSENE
ncbi:hypothetical protein FS749_002316 [Ceratobasidium sp. UAMH 11750]|nr:hypothetical protein FS749_002316 [Ceratobasidium sp. UAMH 11750]